jgi:hypothetical protein
MASMHLTEGFSELLSSIRIDQDHSVNLILEALPKGSEIIVFPQEQYERDLEYDAATGKLASIRFRDLSRVDVGALPQDESIADAELLKTVLRFKGLPTIDLQTSYSPTHDCLSGKTDLAGFDQGVEVLDRRNG